MRKLAALAVVAAALSAAPAVADHGGEDWTQTGTILLSNPATRSYGGATELVSPCGDSIDPDVPPGAAQGVDGYWFEIPTDSWGHDARLTSTDHPAGNLPIVPSNDVDAWFYDDSCTLIRPNDLTPSAYHMTTAGSNEYGVIPAGAGWVVVDLVTGANATFTFTILGYPAG